MLAHRDVAGGYSTIRITHGEWGEKRGRKVEMVVYKQLYHAGMKQGKIKCCQIVKHEMSKNNGSSVKD
jgi:hypothetical protein